MVFGRLGVEGRLLSAAPEGGEEEGVAPGSEAASGASLSACWVRPPPHNVPAAPYLLCKGSQARAGGFRGPGRQPTSASSGDGETLGFFATIRLQKRSSCAVAAAREILCT